MDSPARLRAFGAEIDAVRRRIQADIGEPDVVAVKRVAALSRVLEVVGRALIHFSIEPVGFGVGVVSLALHKQLHGSEIGHAVLHGAYDKLPGARRYASKGYWWEMPIDEECWHEGHNIKHHQYTNIVGKDPDVRYGTIRLNANTAHRPQNTGQAWHPLFVWPSFSFNMAAHFAGIVDLYTRREDEFEVIADRTPQTVRKAHRRWLRKLLPYYAKEYVLFPALAGPMFWKVALGNWMAEVLRSVYSAATIFTGHVGHDTASFPEGTKARSRAHWYAMQVEGANNFEVPHAVSVLCGGLDKQIEHHLFPKFPPRRLRQVAPEIREICARHGVRYRTGSWPTMLRRVFSQIRRLARPDAAPSQRPTTTDLPAMPRVDRAA